MNSFEFGRFGTLDSALLLDLGAGTGRHCVEALICGAKVIALELDTAAATQIYSNVVDAATYAGLDPDEMLSRLSIIFGDARSLPFPSKCFDVVIVSEVLEHIKDDCSVLGEVSRVCKDGGHVGVSVPRAFPELINWALSKQYHSVKGGHIRIYMRSELMRRLERNSLRVVSYTHVHGLHAPYWWLRCLVGPENMKSKMVIVYHDMLVKQMMGKAKALDLLDRVLNPILGKSLVIYARTSIKIDP